MLRNQLVEYYPEKETLPPLIEEYVPMDRNHDDFYERLLKQRIQKINNPGQSGMEDSLPFPIEPLSTAPVTLLQKRVSNTSSDSGVNSPHVLSPAMPITPDNSQSRPIPSTSRMNPPSGPLTFMDQPGTEELTNLLSALQDFTKFPHFKNTHILTRYSIKELIRQCQFSTPDDQATSPKRNKTNSD